MNQHCKKCNGTMKPSKAITNNAFKVGVPDFPDSTVGSRGQTVTATSDGTLFDCLKCEDCGWSVTAAPLKQGDYVLATKYDDGDPGDQWCVGFFDSMLPKAGGDRYMVVDAEGRPFRGNGFRRCEKISTQEGVHLLKLIPCADFLTNSVWSLLNTFDGGQGQ